MADPTLTITPDTLDVQVYFSRHLLTADWSLTDPKPPIGWPIYPQVTIRLDTGGGWRVYNIIPTTNAPHVLMPADYKPAFNLLLWYTDVAKPPPFYAWKPGNTIAHAPTINCYMVPSLWFNVVPTAVITVAPLVSGLILVPTPPTGVAPGG